MIQSATDANKINAGFEVNGARIQSAIDSRIINFPNQSDGINVCRFLLNYKFNNGQSCPPDFGVSSVERLQIPGLFTQMDKRSADQDYWLVQFIKVIYRIFTINSV